MSFTISQLSIIRLWHDDFFSVCDNVENFKLRIERNEIKRFKVQNLMMMISNHKKSLSFSSIFFFIICEDNDAVLKKILMKTLSKTVQIPSARALCIKP